MSEFEQSAYQSAEEPEVNEPSIETSEQPSSPQESNYFEIKYNKEPVKVSYDEAPSYIQKGMNYDKVNQRATEYEQHLSRVAQLSGYQSHEDFLQALEEAEKQQERQRYEDAGLDPDVLNQFLESHPDMKYAREMRAKEQETQQIASEIEQLKERFPDVRPEDLTDELFQVKAQRGVPLLHAYLELNFSKLAQQKEQEAIQKLQQNSQASPGSLGNGDVSHSKSVNGLSSKDFGSLVDQVLRGERTKL
jgi:hypothetical protein